MRRDPKGLYAKAKHGEIENFTEISAPYEPPDNPELILQTRDARPDQLAQRCIDLLQRVGHLA